MKKRKVGKFISTLAQLILHLSKWFSKSKITTLHGVRNSLQEARQNHAIDNQTMAMLEGVLKVSHTHVRDIMVSRAQLVFIEKNLSLEDMLPKIIESGHSRFPIVGDRPYDVLGILLAKDLLIYYSKTAKTHFNLHDIMRPAVFVPESKRLDKLLQEFRYNHNHMAIVVDEYGVVTGIVTIEDILEEIVGQIEDEYDIEDEIYIKKRNQQQYDIKALTPIEVFNDYFQAKLDTEEFDTVGGLVMHAFGRLPKRGESTQVGDNFVFKILNADNRRVRLLRVNILPG